MRIYFYPHRYLRDRQLDTIRNWPRDEIVNPEICYDRQGAQVNESEASASKISTSWKQKIPLINLKLRPKKLDKSVVVYLWGGLMFSGRFIVDLDNPWSLVGYNIKAMSLYKFILRRLLLSSRCVEIRCMSNACRESLKELFGEQVYIKAKVHYPAVPQRVLKYNKKDNSVCKFLFVGTQFEIKGGEALLKAFVKLYARNKSCHLDIVTFFPKHFDKYAKNCKGISVYKSEFTRNQIINRFMMDADVLIHPTYAESFGMVALEALSCGLGLIITDVYALKEMMNGTNGVLLTPPISMWNGFMPSPIYSDLANIKAHIQKADTSLFESELEAAMEKFLTDLRWREESKKSSIKLMRERFCIGE